MNAKIRGHHELDDNDHETARLRGETMWCCAALAAERERVIAAAVRIYGYGLSMETPRTVGAFNKVLRARLAENDREN